MLLASTVGALTAADAAEFSIGDVAVTLKGAFSVGTSIRTEQRAPDLIPQANGAAVGVFGTATGGRAQDDGNLNFRKGEPVSTAAKTLIDLEAKYHSFGIFLRAAAWHDFELANGNRPWGNVTNNYTPDVPLGEVTDRAYGRFTGAALLDANIYGNFNLAGAPLHLRGGNQLIPWGVPTTIAGGLGVLNPVNAPALRRPGALSEEARIPFPAIFTRLGVTSAINFEAFYQFVHVRSELDACGAFFSALDYLADRCDKVFLGLGLNDRQSLATGNFASRAPDLTVSDAGQFGLGITVKADAIATQFGAYFAQYHNRGPLVGAIRAGRAEPAFLPGDPDGRNPLYFAQYPEDVRIFSGNFITRLANLMLFGEITHRPNQPMQLNPVDLSNAFLSNVAPTLLRADANATPLGGSYAGYDRHQTTDIQLGAVKQVAGVFGAKALSLGAELGAKHVHDLPDVTLRRYGRSDVFGTGPVNGVCVPGSMPDACSNDGFVSAWAFGFRGRASLIYADALPDVDLIPSAVFGYDVKGWSYDGVLNEGRQFAILSLRADIRKRFSAEIAYTPVWGGRYNNLKDRDIISFVLSARL